MKAMIVNIYPAYMLKMLRGEAEPVLIDLDNLEVEKVYFYCMSGPQLIKSDMQMLAIGMEEYFIINKFEKLYPKSWWYGSCKPLNGYIVMEADIDSVKTICRGDIRKYPDYLRTAPGKRYWDTYLSCREPEFYCYRLKNFKACEPKLLAYFGLKKAVMHRGLVEVKE